MEKDSHNYSLPPKNYDVVILESEDKARNVAGF